MIVKCVYCDRLIYKMLKEPLLGGPLNPRNFKSLTNHPDPNFMDPVACPNCHRNPFYVHNDGLQVLLESGDVLPKELI